MKRLGKNIVGACLIVTLICVVNYTVDGQCSIAREVNSSFEERELKFYDPSNGEIIRSIDLKENNPYNGLPFKNKSTDPDYGMNAYKLSSAESEGYTRKFLGDSSQDTIVYLNSQVDVVIDKDCNAVVSYGLYRMSSEGEYLSFASTIQIYKQNGDLISEIVDNNHLLTTPVFTNDYTYLMVGATKNSDSESIRLIDLVTKRTILELDRCENEMWNNPAKIQNSDLLMVSITSGYDVYDDTVFYVFDSNSKKAAYIRIGKEETRNIVGFYPDGLVMNRPKGNRRTLSYVKHFESLKLN